MKFFDPLWVAVSTYSILPTPRFAWDEDTLRNALCCLPIIGLLPGGALLLWAWVCGAIQADGVLFATFAAVLPLLLTGGIHMDGFMDTVDALASHQSREDKLAILKDPHCGAFAVIYCGIYLLVSFGFYHALYQTPFLPALCVGFVLSRALGAACALTLPKARAEGMLHAFTQTTNRRAALLMWGTALVCAGAMLCLSPLPGGCALAFAGLALVLYRRMVMRQFGGATGDTSGFCIQLCELALLLGGWVGGLL